MFHHPGAQGERDGVFDALQPEILKGDGLVQRRLVRVDGTLPLDPDFLLMDESSELEHRHKTALRRGD